MKINDIKALKEINKARSCELYAALESYPENERFGRSDMQMLADETSYIISCFEETGHVLYEDIEHAKKVLRETKNGKVMPWYIVNGLPYRPKYTKSDITIARDAINEKRRLVSLMKRLNNKGYFGKWL